MQETAIASSVSDPNIVELHGIVLDVNAIMLVFNFI
jgi:hypothetical protein